MSSRIPFAQPLISLLMPAYNPGRYLAPALESVLSQDFQNWELVVQDAGSTDGALALLDHYAARDERVKVVSEPDNGQSDALNRALKRASGAWVGWLNADDLLCEGALRRVADCALGAVSPVVVFGDWEIVDADGDAIRHYEVCEWSTERFFRDGCYIFSGAIFWPRSILVDGGGWRTELHYCMDLDLALRLGKHPARHAGSQLGVLRWHTDAKSSRRSSRFLREALNVRRKYAVDRRTRALLIRATLVMIISTGTARIRFGRRYSQLRPRKQF